MNTRDANVPLTGQMPDVQGSLDERRLAIQRVGVKGVRYPVRWRTASGTIQPAVGNFALYVALPEDQKGTHMSRFIALLEDTARDGAEPLDVAAVTALHQRMLGLLEARSGRFEMNFPLFVRKTAPVSGVQSLMDYEVCFIGSIREGGSYEFTMKVVVPVTSLCPCSKKISEYGAHNQRSHVTVTAVLNDHLWIEEMVQMVEAQASCEVFGLLKRPDEKWVTERAYDNPKFVEDMVRDVAARLNSEERIDAYVVESENFESIHNHSAYALIEKDKTQG